MKKRMMREISAVILSVFLFLQVLPYLPVSNTSVALFDTFIKSLQKASVIHPNSIEASGISSASATLSNPRLSVLGQLLVPTLPIGSTYVQIWNASSTADKNAANLFPNDSVQVGVNPVNTVASTSADLSSFTLKTGITTATLSNEMFYSSQSGTLKMTFYTNSSIPANGSIIIQVPAPAAGGNDGRPDTGATVASNGFDTGLLTGASSGFTNCPGGFTAGTFTTGTGGAPHTFICNNGATPVLAGVPLTVTIGTGALLLINPAPLSTGHVRGISDVYKIVLSTNSAANGAGSLVDTVDIKVAPVEGVLVSATIDETLSFTVGGLNGGTYCGVTSTITTTATSVPWGNLSPIFTDVNHTAAQLLSVATNSPGGYTVYAEENDQMGKDGTVCTGATPSLEPYTYSGGGICIRDYNKGVATWTTSSDWTSTPGTDYGLGYSLEAVGAGTTVPFNYGGGLVFNTKHFADQEAVQDKYATSGQIMSSTWPVSADSARVCYRINISGTQPAGYYYNKIKYTAVAKF